MVGGEAPFGVEVGRDFGEKGELALFVLCLGLLSGLLEAEDVDCPAVAAAGEPLGSQIERY